jgi:hypothetical protein
MSEKSDPGEEGPLPPRPEPNPGGEDALPPQHDGAQTHAGEPHKIGRGQPPRNTRWKKGGPSPNPKGRPRKGQTMLPDLKKALEQALNQKVLVSRGAKKALMTRIDIGLEQLLNQVAQGDRHAWRAVMDVSAKVGLDFQAQHKHALQEALAPNHQAILDAALARLSGANNAAPPPVMAPPELLDDDRAETVPGPEEMTRARAPANIAPRPDAAPPTATKTASTPISVAPIETKAAAAIAGAAPVQPAASSATRQAPSAPISAVAPRRIATPPTPPAPTKAQLARRPEPTINAQAAPKSPPPSDPEPNPLAPKPFHRMLWTEKRAWYPEWWARHVKWCADEGVEP